jgi:hypothetical protein
LCLFSACPFILQGYCHWQVTNIDNVIDTQRVFLGSEHANDLENFTQNVVTYNAISGIDLKILGKFLIGK